MTIEECHLKSTGGSMDAVMVPGVTKTDLNMDTVRSYMVRSVKKGRRAYAPSDDRKRGVLPDDKQENKPVSPHEGINEGINDGINEGINGTVLQVICERPGMSAPALAQRIGKSLATTERSLSVFVAHHKIEHRGSKKTGGYYSISQS